MPKSPLALRTAPSKDEVYRVFDRLLQRWPEDKLRPTRNIRSLKPMTPSNPNFDERHYYYQSAAMKILLSNKLRNHYKLSDQYMKPQFFPEYYSKFRERLDREGLPRERGSLRRRFWDYLTGKEKSIN